MSSDPNKKIYLLFDCLDWRLHPQLEEYFIAERGGCDCCITAGSIQGLIDEKTRDYFLNQIEISLNLHNCQGAILTMHMDCGAYGGSKKFENDACETEHHAGELKRAAEIISGKFPSLPVECFIVGLKSENGQWIATPKKIG